MCLSLIPLVLKFTEKAQVLQISQEHFACPSPLIFIVGLVLNTRRIYFVINYCVLLNLNALHQFTLHRTYERHKEFNAIHQLFHAVIEGSVIVIVIVKQFILLLRLLFYRYFAKGSIYV